MAPGSGRGRIVVWFLDACPPMIPPPPIALRSSRERRAFTLIELLTVIAIIGILVAILFPVMVRVRAAADSAQCLSQLAQIGTAIGGYTNDHDGTLPGPLNFKQGPTYGPSIQGALAQFLESYLTPPPKASTGTSRYSPVFECPAAARKSRDPTTPTYFMNMLTSPESGRPVWGDINTGAQPMAKAAFVNWSQADDNGHPLTLSEMWAMQDADQAYVASHTNFFTGSVNDVLPLPAHEDHYNALFFDFHVASRTAGLSITEPAAGSTPAPSTTPDSPPPSSGGQ
jgi:prepilin-type N-terminal cleavage/methylation domain-containing protein